MKLKKRKYMETAKTGQIGPDIEKSKSLGSQPVASAKSGPIGGLIGANKMKFDGPGITAKSSPYEMGITAKLRSAKKLKEEAQAPRKVVGEVELGPTETQESVRGDRLEYYKRLKKRSK